MHRRLTASFERAVPWAFALGVHASGCSSAPADDASRSIPDAGSHQTLSREELMKPETCQGCHPTHYREWASSMHAYAAQDPVFIAMNQRGQRETDHGLGQFCVNCHAPMAVVEGMTTDGLNLDELPSHLKGVTCYFCHNVIAVDGDHNNMLRLANDTTMRGGIRAAVRPSAHRVEYSPLHDRNDPKSAGLCGGCHDIVTPNGVHLERTFREYKESLFSQPGPSFDTCVGCHMDGREGVVAVDPTVELPRRQVHEHLWPGVDVALTDFPDREAQRIAVECALANGSRIFTLEANPIGEFKITLETNAGHSQPSGSALDRRLWLEFIAYDEDDNVIYSSGVIGDGEVEQKAPGEPGHDPDLVMLRDRIYDASGDEVHMFWEAAASEMYPTGYSSFGLPARQDLTPAHTVEVTYQIPTFTLPARVTVRARMRPMGLDVLQDLVDSGDLDPAIMSEVPTLTLHGTVIEWRQEDGLTPVVAPEPSPLNCPDDYLCLLNPAGPGCQSDGG
jgi:hypothetical protein